MGLFHRLEIKENIPIRNLTSFKIGGKARYFVIPRDVEELQMVLEAVTELGVEPFILGSGTNLLVWDEGVLNRLFIRLGKGFSYIKRLDGNRWEIGAGVGVDRLVRLDPSSFSLFLGLPGTIGGGLKGNAGVRVGDKFVGIADICESVRVMSYSGQIREIRNRDLVKGYRYTNIDGIILSSTFCVDRMEQWRGYVPARVVVEGFPNAGCVFKNPSPDVSAGKLIDEMGFKGYRVGDAMVSNVHANFILNMGRARFSDVMQIVDEIKECARNRRGIDLELEIKVVR